MTNLRILLVGRICGDDFSWDIAPLPVEEREPVDGTLQRTIDEAEMTAEYESWLEDIDFIRHGGA